MRWKTSWSSVLVLAAACSTGTDWKRDGTSREAMEADLLACDSAARAERAPPELVQRVERCMRERGYTFQRARRLLM
jgi:hypothetical protein